MGGQRGGWGYANGEEVGCTFCCPRCGGAWEGWVGCGRWWDCGRSDVGVGGFGHFAVIWCW